MFKKFLKKKFKNVKHLNFRMAETKRKVDEMKRSHLYREKSEKKSENPNLQNPQVIEWQREKEKTKNLKRLSTNQ